MSVVVTTNRGGICSVCQEKFGFFEYQFTHRGGENHDGFHETCLEPWLDVNPTCPIDRQPIDPSSLIFLAERIKARREALTFVGMAGGGGALGIVLLPTLLPTLVPVNLSPTIAALLPVLARAALPDGVTVLVVVSVTVLMIAFPILLLRRYPH